MPFQDWLVKMLQHSGIKPGTGLIALFDLLQQWVDAPGFRQAMQQELLAQAAHEPLLDYLVQQAGSARCSDPDGVARQIYYLALGALHEEIRHPGCGAIASAQQAATILLAPSGPPVRRYAHAAIAATLAGLLVLPMGLLLQQEAAQRRPAQAAPPAHAMQLQQASLSPDQTFTLHQTLEKLQNGVCQYPQALMLPPEQRPVLIENIVNGEPSASQQRMRLAQQVAQSVDCYYPPIAMTSL